MKALSLHQPWASLVMLGAKRFETRSWRTHYRGPLLIHACKRIPPAAQRLPRIEPFKTTLAPILPDGNVWRLPRGCLLGIVEVVGCLSTEAASKQIYMGWNQEEADPEAAFGNFSPERWAWELRVLQRFEIPIPMAGHLRLWDVPDPLLTATGGSDANVWGVHRPSARTPKRCRR